jgi:hypothetical protein
MILNKAQLSALNEVAKAEMRTPEQMLSLLLAEGIRFYFCDYDSPHGRVSDVELTNALTEDAEQQISTQ